MTSTRWIVVSILLAAIAASIHPRKGWSYFIRELDKPSFKPVGSANLLEDWGVVLEWANCPDIEVGLFNDGNSYVKCKSLRPITMYSVLVPAEKGSKLFEALRSALCNPEVRNLWADFIGISAIRLEESQQVQFNLYALSSSLARYQNIQ